MVNKKTNDVKIQKIYWGIFSKYMEKYYSVYLAIKKILEQQNHMLELMRFKHSNTYLFIQY